VIRRRDFITLLGGAAAAWPIAARAQQPTMPVIGFLHSASPETYATIVAAFRQGLSDAGYVEDQNVTIEFRWARGQYDRLPVLAADLVRRPVAVVIAGGPPAARAAKAATPTIPIVFITGGDPVTAGLVASLSRPSGNVTGVSVFTGILGAKKLGLLRELVPGADVIAFLGNPQNPTTEADDVQVAAKTTGHKFHVVNSSSESEFEGAFATIAKLRAGALIVGADPFFLAQRDHLVALAKHHAIPAMYELREFTAAGGLISYGVSLADGYRQAGLYTGRVLKGTKPADLPVLQPTRFELVINLKTANALGLTVPNSMQLLADEVIE
jgi:putative tryptophan/tyrosine transport system substrate-binding protein